MKCQHAQELFSDYIVGATDRAMTVTLENHLAGCERCQEEVEGLRGAWSVLDTLPSAEPPLYFHENIMSRLDAEIVRVEQENARKRAVWDWRMWLRPRPLAVAAAVFICVFMVLGIVQISRPAGLNPFSWFFPSHQKVALRPPVVGLLKTSRAEWMRTAQGPELVITLQALPAANGSVNQLQYEISGLSPSTPTINTNPQGIVTSDNEISIPIPFADRNATIPDAITVTLTPVGKNGSLYRKEFPLSVTQSVEGNKPINMP